MGNIGKNVLFWIVLLIGLAVAYDILQGSNNGGRTEVPFSDFLGEVSNGQVAMVTIQGQQVESVRKDGTRFTTYTPNYPSLVDILQDKGVKINAAPQESAISPFWSIVISWFPILLLVGVYIFFMRQMQAGGNKAMGFGKSRARMLTEKTGKITFADVAGITEAKEELAEIVDFLKDPQKFQALGGKIPKGCLLVGPPGTGKTLLARAIAGEASVPFFTISGSDFVEMFVGVGASRVRDMFEQGKKNAPCIIFIDEIDAVGRHRGVGYGGGNDEREQTLNQLLVEMDGFESNEGVILIAATNRPDVLDPALLRPGRFDRQIVVPVPDIAGREQILNVHLKKVPMGPDVDARTIARGTPGFSGAELANLVNEAALLAARGDRKAVTMHELEAAKDKVMMGAERKSMVMKDEEKRLTAYHEAGHAIVAFYSPASDPIHKATIIPRGRALGMVMRLPEDDRHSETREELKTNMKVAMGGRAAEEIIFGYEKVTSGASSDIQAATRIARHMVTRCGMSDKVGTLDYSDHNDGTYGSQRHISEEMTKLIDGEVKAFVDEALDHAESMLKEHIDQLHLLAKALLEYETLTGQEIADILEGRPIRVASNDNKDIKVKKSSIFGGTTTDADTPPLHDTPPEPEGNA